LRTVHGTLAPGPVFEVVVLLIKRFNHQKRKTIAYRCRCLDSGDVTMLRGAEHEARRGGVLITGGIKNRRYLVRRKASYITTGGTP
jgi:hypothetical protein